MQFFYNFSFVSFMTMNLQTKMAKVRIEKAFINHLEGSHFFTHKQNSSTGSDEFCNNVCYGLAFSCTRWPLNNYVSSFLDGFYAGELTTVSIKYQITLLGIDC